MTRDTIRQGDLLFIPVEATKPADIEPEKAGVIREGEATGHHHRVNVLEASVFRFRDPWQARQNGEALVIVGDQGAVVTHEEHGPVQLEANRAYRVNVAREANYLDLYAPRFVRD